jgi:nitroreductase
MQDSIRFILEAAIRAPSGENAQPWEFLIKESLEGAQISVRVASERDESLYNWEKRASYFSIGAAIENMRIAARGAGLSLEITLFPEKDDPLTAADIVCKKNPTTVSDPLEPAIAKRVTNRKPYRTSPLPDTDMEALGRIGDGLGLGTIRITNRKEDLAALGAVGAGNEQIMLGNQTLHDFFFNHVSWTKKEDELKKVGFYIKTLELPPPAQIGFKIARKWNRARFLNSYLNFNKVAAAQNAQGYAKAGAMGAIIASEESPVAALRAGMLLERVWLEATQRGLSFQPMAGLLYLHLRLRSGDTDAFSEDEKALIRERYAEAARIFEAGTGTVYFMFRVGVATPPSARSLRFPLEKVITILS